MKAIALSVICIAGLGACALGEAETAGEATQPVLNYGNNIFYEKFDPLQEGLIGGQAGWTGDCRVVKSDSADRASNDKNLDCTGAPGLINGRNAMHTFFAPRNRNYHLQFDVWTKGVVDTTHGKVFLEAPPGDGSNSILQIAVGCDNIRATFEYHNNTTRTLLSYPCTNGVRFRVACIWRDGGPEFRCGAAVYPNDPQEANFISIPALDTNGAPESIGPFDRIRLLGGIGQRVGTSSYDKVQVLSD